MPWTWCSDRVSVNGGTIIRCAIARQDRPCVEVTGGECGFGGVLVLAVRGAAVGAVRARQWGERARQQAGRRGKGPRPSDADG